MSRPKPPRCPATQRRSFNSESAASEAAALRSPILEPVRCEHCSYWHFRPRAATRMTRLQQAVIAALLATPGPVPRDGLREIAHQHSNQFRGPRAGGGRRSTNELRSLLANLERDNLVIRSESTVTVVDAEALRGWAGTPPAAPDEEAPCPTSSPPEDS
jgi:hypothetical protein